MKSSHKKKLILLLSALILISGVFFVLTWQQEHRKPNISDSTNEPVASSSSTNEAASQILQIKRWETPTYLVNEVITPESENKETGYKTMINRYCNITYTIPYNWLVQGFLGESKILNPEDQRKNEEWDRTHQDLIQNTEGDATGLDARSLIISCQDGIGSFLKNFSNSPYYKEFEHAQHLTDAVATGAFSKIDSNPALVKTMKINGQDAYEISETGILWDGSSTTTYQIIIEKGDLYNVSSDHTEYDNLSDAVKQIIQSISFE